MVKKLIKYDFMSFFRVIFPIQLILLGIALLNRLIQFFENDSIVYGIIFTSSVVLIVISSIVCLVMTTVLAIVRYYKGLYSNEGYLSFTLPVTVNQHLISKLTVAVLFNLGSLFSIFLASCVATFGEVNIEIFKAAGYLLKQFYKSYEFHATLIIAEVIFMILSFIIYSYLLIYFCIAIGQLAKKAKVLAAFGVYFAYYVLTQIAGTLIIIFLNTSKASQKILIFMSSIKAADLEWKIGLLIIFNIVLSVIFYSVNKIVTSKKLNLT